MNSSKVIMKILRILAINCMITSGASVYDDDNLSFPEGFKFGAATASFQIEGAWNHSDKGETVWDVWTHSNPSPILDSSSPDVSCNSYYKYKEDVEWIKTIGLNYYRFSISWSRILPTGLANRVSRDGLQYYKNLTRELLANGIEPVVTIYHFDHPQMLEDMGGWTNELMVDWYVDYARIIFRELGPSVKIFITINEPQHVCRGYRKPHIMSPGKQLYDVGVYLCYHNILKAHAKTYHMYNEEFRDSQHGQIGLTFACTGWVPGSGPNDTVAADTAFQFDCGSIAHPIYVGDYPEIMKTRVAMISAEQGYSTSRLPVFTPEWISYIRGTADYFGLNHYTSYIPTHGSEEGFGMNSHDSGIRSGTDPSWKTSSAPWLKVVPEGFGNLLRKIKDEYNNPPVFVLENGYPDHGEILDFDRIDYLHSYLKELLTAIKRDGCNILRYTIWSLLDNFQLDAGYTQPFGIIDVDFDSPHRNRTAKLSAFWWKEVIRTHRLQDKPSNNPVETNLVRRNIDQSIAPN